MSDDSHEQNALCRLLGPLLADTCPWLEVDALRAGYPTEPPSPWLIKSASSSNDH